MTNDERKIGNPKLEIRKKSETRSSDF